jgi:glycosyltransferase involved in cell wall biosynthesis
MKKRLLLFTHHIQPSANPNGYRIGQYFPFFEKRGFEVIHLTTRTNIGALARALIGSDVVYVQRLLLSPLKRSLLKMFGRRIVFDFDDAIMYGAQGESPARRARFKQMVRLSHAVFCGNDFLRSETARYKSDNILYVPTVVDTAAYPIKEHSLSTHQVAGWIGSASTLRYLEDMEGLFTTPPTNTLFKVVADQPPRFGEGTVIFEKWSGDREKQLLLSFDVGMMPVRDDIWSLGKCGLKLIQYAASGLPSISHPIGVSGEIIEEGESGFLRKDLEGWREALERLVNDVDLRKRMGKKARLIAEERYSLEVWGPRVAKIVDSL